MQSLRRALLAVITVLATALPASAQTAAGAPDTSLIYVWVWILIAGIIIMVIGTSMGVNSTKK